jgi:cation-transporting P-type ATPase E
LISTLTIGVPAFILALAPNAARARPHFVARVARFAVPAGIVAAGATYLAYVEAREDSSTSLTAARTLATVVLAAIALWVLAILERGGVRRERWLVPAMGSILLLCLAIPASRDFFALTIPRPLILLAGVGAAALSGVALEAGWQLSGWAARTFRRSPPPGDLRL